MIGVLNVRDLNPKEPSAYTYVYTHDIHLCIYVCVYIHMYGCANVYARKAYVYIYIYISKYYTYRFPESREFSRSREDL